MLSMLLPARADNGFRGHKAAPWLLGLVLVMKTAISLGSIFNGRVAAGSADGIPIDTFTPAAAQTVVTLFALLGIANLMLCLVGVLVLIRYRGFTALMFLFFIVEHVSRKLALLVLPIERTGSPPGSIVGFVILGVLVLGFALSLWGSGKARASA